jgi:endonuclease/exonuclease/phosphatase family metal-dependent hydrolase
MNLLLMIAAIIVGTWNGKWFPSGRAEHRAHPAVEAATVTAAARMLASGIDRLDPEGDDDVILCLGEMRGPVEVSNLVAQIGRKDLKVAVTSRYRRRDRYDMLQNAIATTLPVADAGWRLWEYENGVKPPRGYAYAAVITDPATTATVYSVHLKSNYGQGRDKTRIADNRAKRTEAIRQIVDRESGSAAAAPVIVAGDFNADRRRREFAEEKIFDMLEKAGFSDLTALIPEPERYSYPNRRHGNSLLDYIFCRALKPAGTPITVDTMELSDHMAVFAVIGRTPDGGGR